MLYDGVGWRGIGWEVGREVQEGGTCVYLWLIHVDGWQKPVQYGKAIILQLKINKSKETITHVGMDVGNKL